MAGYRTPTGSKAYELSKSNAVLQYINNRKAELIASKDITNEEVIGEYRSLAFSNITDILVWDKDGKVIVRPSEELSLEVKKSIKKIKHYKRSYYDKEGNLNHEDNNIEIELHDKQQSLDKLGVYLGMWEKKSGDTFIVNQFLQQIQNRYGMTEAKE